MAYQFYTRFRSGSGSRVSQKGTALILLVFMIALIFTTYAIRTTTGVEYRAERDLKTAKALVEAKAALLGWSVRQSNSGQLPCPEDTLLIGMATEGLAKTSCTLPAIGRLPWKTLGIGDIRDGNNEKLWYAISPGFRTPPININTAAALNINALPNSAVAIIFSSGMPLSTQSRPVPTWISPPDVIQYLDLSNNDGDSSFVTSGGAAVFNDKLMTITKEELFSLVVKRILREIRGDNSQGLMKYHSENTFYAFADINSDGIPDSLQYTGTPSYEGALGGLQFSTVIKSMLTDNGWPQLIDYVISLDRQTVTMTLNSKTIVVTP